MNSQIVSHGSFILIILMSFTLQSCLTPKVRSIKNWERDEMNTQEKEKFKQQNLVAFPREIKILIFKEMRIVSCIDASSETYRLP